MSAAVLAEGVPTFEDRANGEFVVVTFPNGAALVMSRGELFNAGRLMQQHAVAQFKQQQADILQFAQGRRA